MQMAVVVVGMLERILIQLLLLLEVQPVAVLAVVQEEDTKPASADGSVREQRVQVFLDLFLPTLQVEVIRIVDVHHPDARQPTTYFCVLPPANRVATEKQMLPAFS